DIYLNIASIANFQPFITSGKVPPPANPLVISQPCIRLEDLESIGRSGRHLTIFEMMAHHAFNSPSKEIYWKNETVKYCDEFLMRLGIDMEGVVYKEAPWAGGGNAGPCLEVITSGLELATLVFMDLKLSSDGDVIIKGQRYRKMENYIVDTGYGLERFVWASKGTPTIYDAIFPHLIKELMAAAGINHPLEKDMELTMQYYKLLGSMGVEEVEKKLKIPQKFIKDYLEPMQTIYAIADHTKCLAFMLADGIIPSNAKEGYLARLIIRRALRMLKSLKIEMPLEEIVIMQIRDLRSSFPELEKAIDRIVEILSLEKKRYEDTLLRGERLVKQVVKEYKGKGKRKIELEKMISLYDTYGLPPEFVKEVVSSTDASIEVEFPKNFYSIVATIHSGEGVGLSEMTEGWENRVRKRVSGLKETVKMYYEEPYSTNFEATVLDAFDNFVILDKTLFYPEGGGQPADTGFIIVGDRRLKVVDVKNVDGVILHKIEGDGGVGTEAIERGAVVRGEIDFERRMALCRQHSATHVILCAARKVLGEHVWQAGAQKGVKRSRLDITHFKRITDAERKEIEMLANKIVMQNRKIIAAIEERNEAEKKYGFRIYQGGVPPGKEIRIVKIEGEGEGEVEDVQACAGTHCSRTGEIGIIKILRTERIQDGIERIEFSAGEAAISEIQLREEIMNKSASILRVPYEKLPMTVSRFFEEWKLLRKENEKLRESIADIKMQMLRTSARDICGEKVVIEALEEVEAREMMRMASQLSKEGFIVILMSRKGKHVSVVSSVPSHLKGSINAVEVVKHVCEVLGGSGGGKVDIAQGGGAKVEKIEEAKEVGVKLIENLLTKTKNKVFIMGK
ncbi:MAG: alanine--tRNA ligase, partial [Candidatus Methanospirareceae archaeon]